MSDIFISYSKADRDLAFKLSAVLEAEGWSVWWDKSVERKRVIYVFNKADLLPDPGAFLSLVRERYPHAILTSTIPQSAIRNPQSGVDDLVRALRTSAQALRPVAEIRVPVANGKLLATLR